jgi:hypothetical protein
MCRNIKTLYNFDPPATTEEIREAALQFVRKLSGFRKPSSINQKAFETAVAVISKDAQVLLESLRTDSQPKNREDETKKARERSLKRFGG